MTEKIKILFLSSNPWTTSRILVDEEEREIFEKLQEGPHRDRFELHRHAATRPMDLQRLLMMHEPHIVHFSGHGSLKHKIILGGKPGRGKQVDQDGLVKMFALYKKHVRLVVLNACFTKTQARSLSEVIDYSVGAGQGIGDKEGVAFAGAFYRALGFGNSVKLAFESARAELALTKMRRAKDLALFIREGLNKNDSFPNGGREHGQKRVFPTGTKAKAPARELMRFVGRRSDSAVTTLERPKPARRAYANRIYAEPEERSLVKGSGSCVTWTVTVFKVAITESKYISHERVAGKDRSICRRAARGK